MTDGNDATELALLEEKIAENDAIGTPKAAWRAAHAVWDKAKLVERLEGPEAALPLYADVARRVDKRVEPGPRGLLIWALHAVAVVHFNQGRQAESRRVFEALVNEHFDDAPLDAAAPVAYAAVTLAWQLRKAGERDRALELLRRVSERYGKPGIPNYRRTAAEVNSEVAWILAETGRTDDALHRLESNIEDLGDTSDPEFRRILVDAYARKAHLLAEKGLLADGKAVCEEIVERFAGIQDPEIAQHVAWAQTFLGE